jgi:hypothetical protein
MSSLAEEIEKVTANVQKKPMDQQLAKLKSTRGGTGPELSSTTTGVKKKTYLCSIKIRRNINQHSVRPAF